MWNVIYAECRFVECRVPFLHHQKGTMTFSKMTLNTKTCCRIAFIKTIVYLLLCRMFQFLHYKAECRHVECHCVECHYVECHYEECYCRYHYVECRYVEGHYVECHYVEYYRADGHYVEDHYEVCHSLSRMSSCRLSLC